MTHVNGPTPGERKIYEQEYKHSLDLFERALHEYKKSDNPFQKEEFHQVMEQALHILNESAAGLIRPELQQQNAQISRDLAAFDRDPKDKSALSALEHDLSKAKHSV